MTWEIEPHVCRQCGGRVLSRDVEDETEYRCSNCGATARGRRVSVLCACGIKARGVVDAGIRCRLNDAPTPELPGQVVAVLTEITDARRR